MNEVDSRSKIYPLNIPDTLHTPHTPTPPIHPKAKRKRWQAESLGLAGEWGPEILASRVPRWESWRSGTFEHSSSLLGPRLLSAKHPFLPFIYSWVGALNHPTPSFILTRSMAFTYRGRRGEIKMAVRYPGILNTTSLAAHSAVRSQRH